jgi:S-disulfanyl-L-cysteine oxidoreductase SoxD
MSMLDHSFGDGTALGRSWIRVIATSCLVVWAALLALSGTPAVAQDSSHHIGRVPTPEEIQAWDISIPPDGSGLPAGQGTAAQGAKVYHARCQECHGAEAKGGDEGALVGGHDTLATDKPVKTATGYWPYATTLFDYTRRAMPFKNPGMLTNDQVYAVVAYLLALDGIIAQDAVMNAETLPRVKMPNRDGFIRDPRPNMQDKPETKR